MAEESMHGSSTEIDYHRVKADPTARISPSCSLVGDVTLGEKVAIMAGSCLRGDDAPIVVEDECNIQEGVVIHEDYGKPVVIGRHTTVGHRAMLHGCVIGENCLIGMSCTIMNGAKIGKNSVVAAGALVTEGKEFPDGVLIVGVPAKVRRELTEEEIADMCTFPGDDYLKQTEAMLKDGVLFNPAPDFNFQA
ncbi:MAG: gamma carbonic anhydrase family protein [Slackia sp.]|nr:gamma carbonic anhydrase family protein [Slackia sp.]